MKVDLVLNGSLQRLVAHFDTTFRSLSYFSDLVAMSHQGLAGPCGGSFQHPRVQSECHNFCNSREPSQM